MKRFNITALMALGGMALLMCGSVRAEELNRLSLKNNQFLLNNQPYSGAVSLTRDMGDFKTVPVLIKGKYQEKYIKNQVIFNGQIHNGLAEGRWETLFFIDDQRWKVIQQYHNGQLMTLSQQRCQHFECHQSIARLDIAFERGEWQWRVAYSDGKTMLKGATVTLVPQGKWPEVMVSWQSSVLTSPRYKEVSAVQPTDWLFPVPLFISDNSDDDADFSIGPKDELRTGKWQLYDRSGEVTHTKTYLPGKDPYYYAIYEDYYVGTAQLKRSVHQVKENQRGHTVVLMLDNRDYYRNGQLAVHQYYDSKTGEAYEKDYYPTGRLKARYLIAPDRKWCVVRRFTPNGTLMKQSTYAKDLVKWDFSLYQSDRHGPTTYFSANGQPVFTGYFYNGKAESLWRQWLRQLGLFHYPDTSSVLNALQTGDHNDH